MAPLFRREPSSRRAEKLVSRGKIEAAIKEYRRLLEADPEDSGTLNRVGDLYARVNKYGEAIDLYRQTAERFVEEGFYVKAIAVYKKIHRLDSNQLDVYEKLAGLYSVQGLVKDARTQYEVLVDYYEKDGQLSSAISNCKKIVELEPKDPAHRTRLAELYERQGDLSKVVNEYLQIARVMLDHGLIEKATQVLERAVEIHPLDVDFLVGAFDLMRRRGQEEFAEEFLADAESRIRQAEKNELFDEVLARIRELPGPVAPPPEETATAPPEPARDEEPEAAVED
ncbi:MAG: tetratricopeptide repeat protein, partial [Thermoanaerobaculia bacterium]|nr:tetratricopeptide repeat protein [Thermoanaerobaculia bacterium]